MKLIFNNKSKACLNINVEKSNEIKSHFNKDDLTIFVPTDNEKLELYLWTAKQIRLNKKVKQVNVNFNFEPNEMVIRTVCELLFANYSKIYSFKKADKINDVIINFIVNSNVETKVKEIFTIYEGVELAKYWSDTDPESDGTPINLSKTFTNELKKVGITCEVLDKKQIKQNNMSLLLTVNQGSSREPRVVIAKYLKGSANTKPILLVGKGLTFDSGGYHLKREMNDMRLDKCGGCDVMAIIHTIAKLKLKINVIAITALTDNLIGSNAVIPAHVVMSRENISVQIDSTDAEGRLTLADAISYGIEKFKPSELIEISTLNGSTPVALGSIFTACWSNNLKYANKIKDASDAVGDEVWIMPMHRINELALRSAQLADISNAPKKTHGSFSSSPAFLATFVKGRCDFVHLDIAGTGIVHNRATGSIVKGIINYLVNQK